MPDLHPHQFTFHIRKHHLSELKSYARMCNEQDFRMHLLSLGQSMFDTYYGSLSSETIIAEIISLLKKAGITSEENYLLWLQSNHGFQLVELSDRSTWTLRHLSAAAFIHIHPARYSLHTRRIKSQHLKQILWLYREHKNFSPENIAECRKVLAMPPTGRFELNGLKEVYKLVHTEHSV